MKRSLESARHIQRRLLEIAADPKGLASPLLCGKAAAEIAALCGELEVLRAFVEKIRNAAVDTAFV